MIAIRHAAAAAIAAACLSFAMPAAAQPRTPVQVTVHTADLNLAAPAGITRLRARVRSAIAHACVSELGGVAGAMDARRCRAEMEADFAPKMTAMLDRAKPVQVAAAR